VYPEKEAEEGRRRRLESERGIIGELGCRIDSLSICIVSPVFFLSPEKTIAPISSAFCFRYHSRLKGSVFPARSVGFSGDSLVVN